MQLGIVGVGRMGGNMARRLMATGHDCVVYNRTPEPVEQLSAEGAHGTHSIEEFIGALDTPRAIWLMIPAAAVDDVIESLVPHLDAGDVMVDGGNSFYRDDLRRADRLAEQRVDYIDVGVSGGVWGLERGYCQMIGGENQVVSKLNPLFKALAPGRGSVSDTPGRASDASTAAEGYLHCGPAGAGHFVKMVHNGIEYGLMAAYAEGFNVLHHANVGKLDHAADAETTPLRHPEHYRYDFNLADIAEVWRRGSVVASWLLDLTAIALTENPKLEGFSGRVADSGEGRWTINAAIEEGAPVPVLSAALFERFSSRGEADFANKVLSAMRKQFGGHVEKSHK